MSPFKVHLVVLLKEMIAAYSANHRDHVNTVFNLYFVVHIVTTECEWLMAFRFFEPVVTLGFNLKTNRTEGRHAVGRNESSPFHFHENNYESVVGYCNLSGQRLRSRQTGN